MKIYVVMHEVFCEACNPEYYEEIHCICKTKKGAINQFKEKDLSTYLQGGVYKEDDEEFNDIFDEVINERKISFDSHSYDRFYIKEYELLEES